MTDQNNSNKNSNNSTSKLILEKLTSLDNNFNDYKKTTDLKLTSLTSIVQTSSSSRILEKLTSLEDNFNNYKNHTDSRFDLVFDKLSSLTSKVDNVVSEVSTLKTQFDVRISSIENKLTHLESSFIIYKKQDSLSHEEEYNNIIYNKLMNNIHINIVKYDFGHIYDLKGNEISDIDGCLLLGGLKTALNKPADDSLNFTDRTTAETCIFVEAKRSLNKPKFDEKLQQILKFKNVLSHIQSVPKDIDGLDNKFSKSLHNHVLDKFTQTIYVVFGSDDIPLELKQFILSVNNGITEDIYNKFIFSLFKVDQTYIFTRYDKKLLKEEKNRLYAINTIEDLRDYCNTEIPKSIKPLCYYMEPYDKFKELYSKFKGFLGILHLNVLIIPYINPSLNVDTSTIPELKDYILSKDKNNIICTEKRNTLKKNLKPIKSSAPTP
jgi:hypothetical protein